MVSLLFLPSVLLSKHMKFIHTSDWHIGRQFHGASLLEDQQHVLQQIIEYIKVESVDAVVIAGDIYDRSVPPANAVALLDKTINQICKEMGVPVIMISGNHDSAERLRFGANQMKRAGLHILGNLEDITQPTIIEVEGVEVAFYGIPYCEPLMVKHTFDVDVKSFDEAHTFLVNEIKNNWSKDKVNVLISHCFLSGAQESDSERPLQVGGADQVSYKPCEDFDYVALGHLHSPQYQGKAHIRYCGSLLKYSFSETKQNKGVTLVDVSAERKVSYTHLPLKPLRDMRVIEGELNSIIEQGKVDPNSDDYLLVKLTDKHAILDAMGQLRAVYPNVLHLEKPGMLSTSYNKLTQATIKQSEIKMFEDFFQQVSGQEMTPEQHSLVSDVVNSLNK